MDKFKVGDRVVRGRGTTKGVIMEFEEWLEARYKENPKIDNIKARECFNHSEDLCIKLDNPDYDTFYYWGLKSVWSVYGESSDSTCNHEKILLLNSWCCKFCGKVMV